MCDFFNILNEIIMTMVSLIMWSVSGDWLYWSRGAGYTGPGELVILGQSWNADVGGSGCSWSSRRVVFCCSRCCSINRLVTELQNQPNTESSVNKRQQETDPSRRRELFYQIPVTRSGVTQSS